MSCNNVSAINYCDIKYCAATPFTIIVLIVRNFEIFESLVESV